jgi:hypothetical protein
MFRKPLTFKEIDRQIEKNQLYVKNLNDIKLKTIEILLLQPESLLETIAQKYIEFQNLNSVVDWLNNSGYRVKTGSKIKGSRKYMTNDVADILEDKNNTSIIFEFAASYFKYNKQKAPISTLIKLVSSN